ncbi:hypothetical protein E2C01_068589 [Portunus trituberculatus]|uniref:Uncharacterized protein n=1 Tax=Portunus trituberculatus TaxID=210409 RepID=A0A5B7HWW6_PORTR|nr:hypothetical protein [Portunus trituberculatus]
MHSRPSSVASTTSGKCGHLIQAAVAEAAHPRLSFSVSSRTCITSPRVKDEAEEERIETYIDSRRR